MRKLLISLTTLLVLYAGNAIAQLPSLGFKHVNFQNTTVELNDTVFFQAFLYNYGNVTFQDPINFRLWYDGALVNDPSIWPSPYPPGPPPVETIPPGDSVFFAFRIIVKAPLFQIGPTGVVIWPKAFNDSIVVHDSIVKSLNIVDIGTGFEESNDIDLLQLQQQSDKLSINGCESCDADIKIYNVSGQLLFETRQNLPAQVPLQGLPKGLLFVNIDLGSKGTVTRKFMAR